MNRKNRSRICIPIWIPDTRSTLSATCTVLTGLRQRTPGRVSEDEIACSIDYFDLDGFNPLQKQEVFEQKQAARKEIEEQYDLSPLRAMCARDAFTFDKGLENIQSGPVMEK